MNFHVKSYTFWGNVHAILYCCSFNAITSFFKFIFFNLSFLSIVKWFSQKDSISLTIHFVCKLILGSLIISKFSFFLILRIKHLTCYRLFFQEEIRLENNVSISYQYRMNLNVCNELNLYVIKYDNFNHPSLHVSGFPDIISEFQIHKKRNSLNKIIRRNAIILFY